MLHARLWLKGLLFIVMLAGVGYLLGDVLDRHWIDVHVHGKGPGGELLFVAAGALLMSAGLSRQVIAFLGGYGFGFLQGTLLGLLAAVVACITVFYIARLLGRPWVARHPSVRLRRVDEFLEANPFVMALLFRLLPVGSNWMINVAAGVSGMRSLPFFAGSALGYIPQMLVFSLVGSGTRIEQSWHIALAIVLFLSSVMLAVLLYRRYRNAGASGDALDLELGVEPDATAPHARHSLRGR